MGKLEILNLNQSFPRDDGTRLAVLENISLEVQDEEFVCILGSSGCGKTTLLRLIAGLDTAGSGRVILDGEEIRGTSPKVGMVFQEYSLFPWRSVIDNIAFGLEMRGIAKDERYRIAERYLNLVNLSQFRTSYPSELSGGMRQRVAIAIALSCEPKLLIADEPTTALDVTIQAQILDLLAREQRRRHMAMIIITHDLGVVAGRTDEVAVMYAGRVVERAPTPLLFKNMHMPYTQALLAAIPKIDAAPHTPLPAISGRPPDPTRPIQGCSFSPRCRYAVARCQVEKPPLTAAASREHQYACFHPIGVHAEAGA